MSGRGAAPGGGGSQEVDNPGRRERGRSGEKERTAWVRGRGGLGPGLGVGPGWGPARAGGGASPERVLGGDESREGSGGGSGSGKGAGRAAELGGWREQCREGAGGIGAQSGPRSGEGVVRVGG